MRSRAFGESMLREGVGEIATAESSGVWERLRAGMYARGRSTSYASWASGHCVGLGLSSPFLGPVRYKYP